VLPGVLLFTAFAGARRPPALADQIEQQPDDAEDG
jgi:hypothetical protein